MYQYSNTARTGSGANTIIAKHAPRAKRGVSSKVLTIYCSLTLTCVLMLLLSDACMFFYSVARNIYANHDFSRTRTHTGGGRGGKPGRYTGHKQPGLHGSKSFGAFWGVESQQGRGDHYCPPRPPLGDSSLQRNGPAPQAHQNPASREAAAGARRRSGSGQAGGARVLSSDVEVVPAVKVKGAVELTPVRGISRVWAG